MADAAEGHTVAWTFRAADRVEHVAASASAAWTLAADAGRRVCVLDGAGSMRGEFRAGQPVRGLRADPGGNLFCALSGDAIIYAFDASGGMQWRVELGGPVTDFDFDLLAERLAAVSTGGWLYLYSPRTRERRIAPVGWPMTSVAVAGAEPPRLAVCNDKGRLALLTAEGKPEWQKDLGCPTGGVCASAGAGLLVVAAQDKGLLLFRLDGQEAGVVRVSQGVRRAAVTPNGALIMAETGDNRLVLVRPDSSALWEEALGASGTAWALGEEGRLAVLARGDREVVAYRIGKAAPVRQEQPVQAVKEPSLPPRVGSAASAPPEIEEIEWPEFMEIEEAVAPRPKPVEAPPARRPHVAWKTRLPSGGRLTEDAALRLSQQGTFLVLVQMDGGLLVLGAQGKPVVRHALEGPAHLAPQALSSALGVWTARQVLVVEPATSRVRALSFEQGAVGFLDGSQDFRFFCVVDEEGRLSAYSEGDSPLWQKALKAKPTGLLLSPRGDTVLFSDAEGRFRYYDSGGGLLRKFRFADQEDHRAVCLGDGLSVFASAQGRLSVLDAAGRELWSRRLFDRITGVELIGASVVAYGESGNCALVEPREDKVWEFQPPPGRVRLRRPAGADPMLVHAAGNAVTVFSGYRRKLDVVWRYTCKDDVSALDADVSTRIVVALAGERLYRLEAPGASRQGAGQ